MDVVERCDLFLSYNSRDHEPVQTVRRLLAARNVNTFIDRENLAVGRQWFGPLEDALNSVRGVAVFLSKNGLGNWQKRELVLALSRQDREEKAGRAFPVIPVLLPGVDLEMAPGLLLVNTFVDLRAGLDDPDALDALVRAVRGEAPPPAQTTVALCPYRGLQIFPEEDAPLFFGRESFADELLKKTRAHPLVAVVGPSGSGKSSVVQAGLLPLLRRERPPHPAWEAAIFTPGKRPFHSLAACLVPFWETEMSETQRLIEAEELGKRLADGTVAVEAALDQALRKSSGTDRLLLVMDQFEELFTLTLEAERRGFVEALLRATADKPVTLVLTLRADFYGQAICLSRALSDGIQQGIVNLGPMTRDELRRAIENPAGVVKLDFEPGLADL